MRSSRVPNSVCRHDENRSHGGSLPRPFSVVKATEDQQA